MGSGWRGQQMSGFGRQALSSSGMAHQGHVRETGNATEHFWALQFGWLLFFYYNFGVLQPEKDWLVLLLTVVLSTGMSIVLVLELLHRLPQLLALWHGTQKDVDVALSAHLGQPFEPHTPHGFLQRCFKAEQVLAVFLQRRDIMAGLSYEALYYYFK